MHWPQERSRHGFEGSRDTGRRGRPAPLAPARGRKREGSLGAESWRTKPRARRRVRGVPKGYPAIGWYLADPATGTRALELPRLDTRSGEEHLRHPAPKSMVARHPLALDGWFRAGRPESRSTIVGASRESRPE